MQDKDFLEEKAYLETVEAFIKKRIEVLSEKKGQLREQISADRKTMWEEGRHGVNEFDDVVDIYLHSEGIVFAENQYQENLKELQRLEKMKDNPYFARVDFVETEYPEKMQIYIGAVGLRDDKTFDMYVCDWRAPISTLFYGFDVGGAWYEVDGRKVEGDLTLKRQIQIENGELSGIYDTNSSMHDAILGGILSANTKNRLKVIVNSIQKEQNTAIRNIDKPVALIYGPAGSGKTSVGLHRLAYILYHQRKKLSAQDIVILSNNNIYHSYVSGILPDLCEDEVSHTIFYDLLRKYLPKGIFIENYYAQYKVLEAGWNVPVREQTVDELGGNIGRNEEVSYRQNDRAERIEWIALKYSGQLLEYFVNYFEQYVFTLPTLKYHGTALISGEELLEKLNKKHYRGFKARFEGLLEMIKKLYDDYFEENKQSIYEEIERSVKEYVSDEEMELYCMSAKKKAVSEAIESIRQLNNLSTEEQLIRVLQLFMEQNAVTEDGLSAQGIESELREQKAANKEGSRADSRMLKKLMHDLEKKHLCYEDALLYLLVRILMGEVIPLNNVLHVLVDEAQDYNILQLYIMKLLYPKSSFTLLADVCQAVSPLATIQSYEEFEWVFGSDLEKLPLLKSYRSSGAINELAFKLMSQFDEQYSQIYSFFQREGKMPEYIVGQDSAGIVLQKVKELQHYNMVGIITENEYEAGRLYGKIKEVNEEVQLITKPHDEMKGKVIIMPLILTKGLEFDAVILHDCVNRQQERAQMLRKLYLGCTRALHELYIVEKNALPEEIESFLK